MILDLNILSETATECRAIADYLRSSALNGKHSVNVVGVEMGNETYAKFFCNAMEFFEFEDYYRYIQGDTLVGNENVLSDDMLGDHDFISTFKTGGGYNYKVGLCGKPLAGEFAFKLTGDEDEESCAETGAWNSALRSKYDSLVPGTSKYVFDAVIMHTYYGPGEFQDLALENMDSVQVCSDSSDLWRYDMYDYRLENAFNKIIGIGGTEGNFRDFLVRTTGDYYAYKISFDEFNDYFDFDLTGANKKDLWVTEGNLKTELKSNDFTETEKQKIDVFSNGFTHAHLLMNWWLKNIKINFDNDYRTNFFTYFTLHNYAGGSSTNLVSVADAVEKNIFDINGCPYSGDDCGEGCEWDITFDERNYHVRRTTYFITYLFSQINKNSLKYLPSTYWLGHSNMNVAPTAFIDPAKEYVYIYFSNVKADSQNYVIDPDNLLSFFPDADGVELGEATITFMRARQLYSTSGKSALFNTVINACYNDTDFDFDHPFEITPETEAGLYNVIITEDNKPRCTAEGLPVNGCLSAPSYSVGYFKIPVYPVIELKQAEVPPAYDLEIFPNPAASTLWLSINAQNNQNIQSQFLINVFSIKGELLLQTSCRQNEPVDVSKLPSGCYIVEITDENNQRFFKKLIKSE